MAKASLAGLSWLNLMVASMQSGFGPFVPLRLAAAGWGPGQIGTVLSLGTLVAVAAQVPAGALVDASRNKRVIAAAAIVTTMGAALTLALVPHFPAVALALIAQNAAGGILGLAIAAITLALSRQERLGERLGTNMRFASLGSAGAAVAFGVAGSAVAPQAGLALAALLGFAALLVLRRIRRADLMPEAGHGDHPGVMCTADCPDMLPPKRALLRNRVLLIWLACAAAFQFSSAALLPLAAGAAPMRDGQFAGLVVAAAVMLPQLLSAALSPHTGRWAQLRGRRPVLLAGFISVPIRALMLSVADGPAMVLAAQLLDGIAAATFGVVLPLVIADVTRESGRFNLALGFAGAAVGLGAAAGNVVAGQVADMAGRPTAFLILAAAGVAATLLLAFALPETARLSARHRQIAMGTR